MGLSKLAPDVGSNWPPLWKLAPDVGPAPDLSPTNVFGVGVSCRNLYTFVVCLYVGGSGSITSVGEERTKEFYE